MRLPKMKCPTCGGSGKTYDPATIGRDLRKIREKRRWDQCAVAERMGISKSYLCDMEKGKRPMSSGMVHDYESALAALEREEG